MFVSAYRRTGIHLRISDAWISMQNLNRMISSRGSMVVSKILVVALMRELGGHLASSDLF
jgi:hypothetical protein